MKHDINHNNLIYSGDDEAFALGIVSDISNRIGLIPTEIALDKRTDRTNGKKIGLFQLMNANYREKFASLANDIIDSHPELERVSVPHARKEKDYALKHKDMDRVIYINSRPSGKRSALGDDPNELATAVLCMKPDLEIPKNSSEMDLLIEYIKQNLYNVRGYKKSQVDSLDGNYDTLCQSISAAKSIHAAGYGNCDMVYLTGQSWHDDVKKFQITKYGMQDFNSSDFVLKKGNAYLGVSLKKKKRDSESDPTLINKSFSSMLQDKKFDYLRNEMDKKTGIFYLRVIARGKREGLLSKELLEDIKRERPNLANWKNYIQRVDNNLINRELKSSKSLFKDMADSIMDNKEMIGNQLLQLIFKSDLCELKKMKFDFALVTGIGDHGPMKGFVVEKGDYKGISTITKKLNMLAKKGGVDLKFSDKIQAFEAGATAAILTFDLILGGITLCNIKLRYKGNFRSSPSFLAVMTDEFKELLK
jgi:hypothetical protein